MIIVARRGGRSACSSRRSGNEEGGSVDEKFPCVVDTYVRLGRPFYVVWGGAGTSTNAIRYLVEKSREYGNFKGVGNMSEFVDFCGREL